MRSPSLLFCRNGAQEVLIRSCRPKPQHYVNVSSHYETLFTSSAQWVDRRNAHRSKRVAAVRREGGFCSTLLCSHESDFSMKVVLSEPRGMLQVAGPWRGIRTFRRWRGRSGDTVPELTNDSVRMGGRGVVWPRLCACLGDDGERRFW